MTKWHKWQCVRQRAGPLVKECRYWLPRFDREDTPQEHRDKAFVKARVRTAVSKSQADRLELRLAALGWESSMHTLTFDDDHLPRNFAVVRRTLKAFFQRSQRWRAGLGKSPAYPYIYSIEGLHTRYHIHFCCRDGDLSPPEVQHLWQCGIVDNEPVLMARGGFRRLAEYLNKERADGIAIPVGRHPWSSSRSLNALVQPAERWAEESGEIVIPKSAIWQSTGDAGNQFGRYYYASWIEADGSRACRKVRYRIDHGG